MSSQPVMFIFRWQIYLLICHSIIIIAHLTNKMQCNLDHKPVNRDQSSTEVSNKRPTVLLKTSFWHLCQSDNNYQTPVRSVLGMRTEWTNQGTSVFRRSFSNVWIDWIQTCFFLVVLHWRKGSYMGSPVDIGFFCLHEISTLFNMQIQPTCFMHLSSRYRHLF